MAACRLPALSLLCAAVVVLGACRTEDIEFPQLDPANSRGVVALGHFAQGSYLPRDPKCGQEYPDGSRTICIDPPPMLLHFVVHDVIYGSIKRSRVRVFSTSHYGLDQIDFGPRLPYLVLLVTDGRSFVIPRYRMSGLAQGRDDRWAVPVWKPSDRVWWLPCPASASVEAVAFTRPAGRFRVSLNLLTHYAEGELETMTDYVSVSDGWVSAQRGIAVDSIRAGLARLQPSVDEMECRE